MRRRPPFGFAKRRRRRRVALLVVCAVLLAGIAAAALRGRELATGVARAALARAGVATETLAVRSLGFGGIVFDAVRLGGPTGPSADAVAVDWTLGGLLHGGLARLRIEGLHLAVAIEGGKPVIVGLPLAGSGVSGVPALPFDRLELAGAQLSFAGTGFSASATIDATVTISSDDALRGSATIAGTATPLAGTPIHLTAELPDWRVGSDGHLVATGVALNLPERGIALSGAELVLMPAGEAPSLSLRGELRDTVSPMRFPPLAVVVTEKPAANTLAISGHAESADRALALTLDGKHDPASGRGALTVHVAPMVFAATGRQPRDLFPALAGNAPSRVAGSVAASFSLGWGGKSLTTALTLTLAGVGFDSGLAIVDALAGTLAFDSLMPLRADAAQHLSATLQIASLPPGPLDLHFRLPSSEHLVVDAATLGLAGGTLSLAALSLRRDQPLDTALDVKAVDIGTVLTLIGIDGLSGSGALDGRIPLHIDPAGVAISGGLLDATGPGVVRYSGASLPAAITEAQGKAGDALSLTRQALADFHYTALRLTLDRAASGDGSLLIALKGSNPAVLDNRPFEINIRLETNFDRLAALLLSGYAAADGLLRHAAGQ